MEKETEKTPREIGRTVSAYFKENGISQEEAAVRLGYSSKQVVANQLYGKRFGRKVAAKYAAVFNFNETFLLTGKGELLNQSVTEHERILQENVFLKDLVKSQQTTIENLSSFIRNKGGMVRVEKVKDGRVDLKDKTSSTEAEL